MPQTLDRRALLKAFLGATLVSAGMKALPAAAPDSRLWMLKTTSSHILSPSISFTVTAIGCPFEVGDVVRITGIQYLPSGSHYRIVLKRGGT